MVTEKDIITALSGLEPAHPVAARVIRELWQRATLSNTVVDEHLARFVGGVIASRFKPGFFDDRMVMDIGRIAVNATLFGTVPDGSRLTLSEAITGFEVANRQLASSATWAIIKEAALRGNN